MKTPVKQIGCKDGMKKNVKEYGELQRSFRKKARLSIRMLSEASGVSHSYLSQIENGTRGIPSVVIIIKVSDALRVDRKTLIKAAGYDLAEWGVGELPDSRLYPVREMKAFDNLAATMNMTVEELTNHILVGQEEESQ